MTGHIRDLIRAANTAPPAPGHDAMIAAGNTPFDLDAHGVMRVPYGDYPVTARLPDGSSRNVIQRMDRQAAEELAASVNSRMGKFLRLLRRIPIFIGHPDLDPEKYPDKASYGRVSAVNVEDEAIAIEGEYNPAGAALIEGEQYLHHSPHWLMRIIGAANETPICRPCWLVSMGLTNSPNIPVPAIAANQREENVMELLPRLLAVIGKDDVSTEDDVVGFVQRVIDAMKKLREALDARWKAEDVAYEVAANDADLVNDVTGLIERLDAAIAAANDHTEWQQQLAAANDKAGAVDELTDQLAALQIQAGNDRKARIELLLDQGIREAKLRECDRTQWEERFGDDFDKALAALNEAKPIMNTQDKVGGLAGRDEQLTPSQAFLAAVNERISETSEEFTAAYLWCKEHRKDLYEAMSAGQTHE